MGIGPASLREAYHRFAQRVALARTRGEGKGEGKAKAKAKARARARDGPRAARPLTKPSILSLGPSLALAFAFALALVSRRFSPEKSQAARGPGKAIIPPLPCRRDPTMQ